MKAFMEEAEKLAEADSEFAAMLEAQPGQPDEESDAGQVPE